MQVLRFEQQANLSQAIHDYIDHELIEKNILAKASNLDLLADAVVGLENFFQTILEESVAPEIGLQVAAQSISKLGYPPKRIALESTSETNTSLQQYNYG